ncbi:MAG: transcriptional regulator [Chloroflexota bacterium]|jgi:DNA-binding transcriptional regulator LsrR (DeoR family)|nr:sugar-binding transcriptional regulator [Caldilinea sp.]GIK71433.1 MAG: transcriptional regulator [Chloroflexota bacterium]
MNEADIDLLSLTAKLYYQDNLDQNAIANIIGVSRSTVSRLLARARDIGIVTISINHYAPRNLEVEEALCKYLGLQRAIVVRTFAEGNILNIRRTVGYIAAQAISEIIPNDSVVGTAGGRTIYDLVRYMQPRKTPSSAMVVQLMGNIGPRVGQIDAIEIAHTLAAKLGGVFYTMSAPVFAHDIQTRDLFLASPQVQELLRLFDRLQVALVGIGVLENSAFVERQILSPENAHELRLKGVVGEICGRFFDIDGSEVDTPYRDQVVGVSLERLIATKEVIAVTNGADRAEAICAAVRGGIVKGLVIDETGANAILEALGQKSLRTELH